MIFPVHKKLNDSRFEPPSQNIWQELFRIAKLVSLPIMALIWFKIVYGHVEISVIVAFAFIAVFCYIQLAKPLKKGLISLGNKILFIDYMPGFKIRKFNYPQIAILHIGLCPEEFRGSGMIIGSNMKSVWTGLYGKYIIARYSNGKIMFAMHYSDEVWKYLSAKCKDTAKYIFSEEEWNDYCVSQKYLEQTRYKK